MKYLTVVYKNPDDDYVKSLISRENLSAMAWGHVIDDLRETKNDLDEAILNAEKLRSEIIRLKREIGDDIGEIRSDVDLVTRERDDARVEASILRARIGGLRDFIGRLTDERDSAMRERDEARVEAAQAAAEANQCAADLASCRRSLFEAGYALEGCVSGRKDSLAMYKERLRDHFAGVALNSLMMRKSTREWSNRQICSVSYTIADIMLKAREAS